MTGACDDLYHMMEEHAEKYHPLEVMTAEKKRREEKKRNRSFLRHFWRSH